jgi:hypothetical protein
MIAGLTCLFVRSDDSDSSSSESETDCEKSLNTKYTNGKSSRRSSEYKPLLNNSNNNTYGLQEKDIIFSAASI